MTISREEKSQLTTKSMLLLSRTLAVETHEHKHIIRLHEALIIPPIPLPPPDTSHRIKECSIRLYSINFHNIALLKTLRIRDAKPTIINRMKEWPPHIDLPNPSLQRPIRFDLGRTPHLCDDGGLRLV